MWQNNKYILGIWVQQYNVRAYVWVSGMGWRKLTNPDDDVTTAMLQVCIHAKAANRPVNFRQVGTEIQEIYVW